MHNWTFEELYEENEKKALGLQYTIAERERLKLLFRIFEKVMEANGTPSFFQKILHLVGSNKSINYAKVINALLNSTSERYQDIFALLLNNCKNNGFFVEFGACDGLAANNTYTLEKYFKWDGILAEPDKHWHKAIRKKRSVKIDNRCVSSETGKQMTFYQSDRPGNSSVEEGHKYLGAIVDSYEVETVSFMDLLECYNAPEYIDFLSVDTEGHEKEVFTNFDFTKYKFGFICVEQHGDLAPEDSVEPLLKDAGYTVIFPREEGRPIPMQITGVDKFFVPVGHPALEW